MFKKFIAILTLAATCFAQTHTTVMKDLNSTITGAVSTRQWIDASDTSRFTGDACQMILAAQQSTAVGVVIDARGFTGDQACSVNPFSFSYQGTILLGPTFYHIATPWMLPHKVNLLGAGWETGLGNNSIGSTVIQACSGAGQYCAGAFPSNGIMFCYTDDGTTCNHTSGPVFDSPLYNLTFDGNNVLGITLLANFVGQEGTGFFRINGFGYGNHGVGINLGGIGKDPVDNGPGSQNTTLDEISLSLITGNTCTVDSIGILVDTGGPAFPSARSISNVTITNQGCASNLYPDVNIQISTGSMKLDSIHCESFQRACVTLGYSPVGLAGGASGISIDEINCGNCAPQPSTNLATTTSISGNTVTVTGLGTNTNIRVGDLVIMSGCAPAGYNNAYVVLTTTATTFTGVIGGNTPPVGNGTCSAYQPENTVVLISNQYAAGTASISLSNVRAVGPNLPFDTIVDEINATASTGATVNTTNANVLNAAVENQVSLYILGDASSFPAFGTNVFTTSWQIPQTQLSVMSTQEIVTSYNCAAQGGNCQNGGPSQPAVIAGLVAIGTGQTTVTVTTKAVTSNSEIFIQEDPSAGSRFLATCSTSQFVNAMVTSRSAGVSFTITISAPVTSNPLCFDFWIVN